MLRIGCVKYLNARPLIRGWLGDVEFDHPSTLCKRLASGELAYQIEETAEGNVKVGWSDGVECQLPANTVLSKSLCSCPATTLCRHLLRSVLAYQQNSVGVASASSPTPAAWTTI